MSAAATLPKYRHARPSELIDGAKVIYRGSWGRGPMRDGVICGGPELNGEEFAWDVCINGKVSWGYLDQFWVDAL